MAPARARRTTRATAKVKKIKEENVSFESNNVEWTLSETLLLLKLIINQVNDAPYVPYKKGMETLDWTQVSGFFFARFYCKNSVSIPFISDSMWQQINRRNEKTFGGDAS